MFLKGISEFESKFKMLDRLNSIVFNVWRDKNALAYRDGDMARITNEYRRYISEVRSLSEQASQLERKLESKLYEINKLVHEVSDIANNPEIRNCYIFEAYGENQYRAEDGSPKSQYGEKVKFVAKSPNEEEKAREIIGDSYTWVHVSGVRRPL